MNLRNIDWTNSLFVIVYQISLLITLPFYFYFSPPSLKLVVITLILIALTGISITAGYHRLYAHKSYSANKLIEVFFLFFATMAFMGSVFAWAGKHRVHHRFVDEEKDPYNIKKGFFHAHMLWFMSKISPFDRSIIPDLLQSRLLQFQYKYINFLHIGTNLIIFLAVGWVLNDFMGVLVMAIGLRMFVVHHATWFINSLAHSWGEKTYSREQTAVNNGIIALLTFGEGYHNYHHVFSSDYRNGIRWFQYDPTKWTIWALSKIGMAKDLKKVDKYVSKNKIIMEDKYIFLKALRESIFENKKALEDKVVGLSARISTKIMDLKGTVQEYKDLKKNRANTIILKPYQKKIKELKVAINSDWLSWRSLEKEVSAHAMLSHHH